MKRDMWLPFIILPFSFVTDCLRKYVELFNSIEDEAKLSFLYKPTYIRRQSLKNKCFVLAIKDYKENATK